MKLYLIRHAQSANNAIFTEEEYWTKRSSDPEITDIGHEQAALLGPHLAKPSAEPRQHSYQENLSFNFGITHLYCSLMTRSILTAEYISKACNLPLHAHENIFEKGGIYKVDEHGKRHGLPGRNREYFNSRFPSLILPESFNDAGWYNRAAESTDEFIDRTAQAVADIRHAHESTNDVVALVVHGDFIDQFINELMNVDRKAENYAGGNWYANWVSNNTSISRIDFNKGAHNVIYLNRIDHLPAELVTW